MSIPKRNSDPTAIRSERTFFVTSATWEHRCFLQSDRNAQLFVDVLFHYRAKQRYQLRAFVVMPDHFHGLMTVGPEISIERVMQFIKGGYSFRASHELGRRGEFWRKGFSELSVASFEKYCSVQTYIHQNPVRRGLCSVAGEYAFSSASGRFQLDPIPHRLKPPDF